ncbi:FG-GAP-like repeat-containing protein [Okeania sp. SIO2B3]|uniref:FG-GAP-like repeat-containing protein n=1 Tax=Okeania sp. SIO2B3 TaxID=2607784 RepID=UPI0013BFD4B3|nr:FG-GAP-like repeat-containing protein [Okeania sp. SIO2B3]NET44600.1 DUF642 domain-containing protein [Okeania sp. SIO2B3]
MTAFSKLPHKTNVAETTIEDEFNPSPQLKQTWEKWFLALLVIVMAVAIFAIPIQTVNATPNIEFTDSQQALGNYYSYGVSLADVDGDGDIDAFVANNFEQPNKVWLNDGRGNFTDSQQVLGSSRSIDVGVADVDGDGDTDAFVANYNSQHKQNKVWLNDGRGNFTDSRQALGNSSSLYVSVADVDGDGDTDAFVANDNQPNKVWLNDGRGNFTDSPQALGRSRSYGVSLADVDGDGDIDAFVANNGQPNKVWLNDGRGNFTDSPQALGRSRSYGVSLADVDGDGDIDAFVANNGQPNTVWLNDGRGNFTDSPQALGRSRSYGVSLADVDGDGDIDAFVANNGQPNTVWLNDGSGNFTDSQQALGRSRSYGMSLADVDGDGDIDAFVANNSQPNTVWLNNLDRYINYPPTNLTLSNNTIDENEPANSVVGTFSTTETDDDTFTYQLVRGNEDTDNSAFTIDGAQLKITNSPDYQTQSTYSIRVQTTDSAGGIFQKVFTININDINYPPTNLTLSNNTIDENEPANSVVGTFSTTETEDNTFTYQLVRGNGDTDNSAFTIDGNQLKITNSPDYQTQSTYSIRVQTTDSAGGIFQKAFTININDINEPPTNLTLSNNTIDENIPANSVVGTFSTTETEDNTFTYQLVRGNEDTDNSAFTIDGNQLKITNSPDYQTQSTYSIRVQTTDSAGGIFQKAFTININDIVEKPTCDNTAPNNLVINGSFEKPVVPGYGFETSIEGWELVQGLVIELNSLYITYPNLTDVYDGSQFVDLDSLATQEYGKTITKIYQKIPTQPGKTYKLTFAFTGSGTSTTEHDKLNLRWGDELVEALDKVDAETTWEVKTYNLQAKSTETVLSFDNLNEVADGYGTRIDGVSLNLCQ